MIWNEVKIALSGSTEHKTIRILTKELRIPGPNSVMVA